MKHTLSILMVILLASFSQAQNDYESLWETVEGHENEGLPKSALKVVETISLKAQQESNKTQQIKVLLYKSKYALILEEDAQLSIINDFKSEIKNNEAPVSNLLENMLASMYWQYFKQNRYKFYNRTNTKTKVDKEDFRTWDLKTLFNEIHVLFQKSLENKQLLQEERLVNYDLLLHKVNLSKRFRPTLYDLLAHNALEFYKTDENSITQPAYKFTIDNTKYLSDINTFKTLKIESKDSLSLQLQALKLYKDLISFHANDTEHYALADVNIQRLKFVTQHATYTSKQKEFLKTLQIERKQYNGSEISGWYDFEIASIYAELGKSYNAKTAPAHRWKLKEALDLCNNVINAYPKSRGATNCMSLKTHLIAKTLQITAEKYIPLQSPSRVLINYTNINTLNFHIYKVSVADLKAFNTLRKTEQRLNFFKSKTPLQNWETSLRDDGDLQQHSTEIVVPQLSNGIYLVLAKVNNAQNTFAVSSFQVTNLALVEKVQNKRNVYQIIDRNNGTPITGASVLMSYKTNYNSPAKTKSFTTDSNGQFSVSKPRASRYFQIEFDVNYNSESAHYGNYNIYRHYNEDDDNETLFNGFLFTDRSIYRPGQTVHYKGIIMSTKNDVTSVLDNEPVLAILYDANRQEIARQESVTNAFGSVASTFVLPNGGLTGAYQITLHGQKTSTRLTVYHNFNVEEYKRPKFETTFNPVTELFKVNDSVTVKGNALAFAGSNITDAKVSYRVTRKVQYPNWYYWRRPWFNSQPQEITHGEGVTNANGEFEITFKALPDTTVDKTNLPTFQYEVTADVTDINGETRSATTLVNVGYHAMTATVSIDSELDKSKKDYNLFITTKNLNGQDVPAQGTIKVYKLNAPETVLRQRPWPAPDYQDIPKGEFKTLFPHDAYTNESNSQFWEDGKLVLEANFNTEDSREIALGKIKNWDSGLYIIRLESKDKFGQIVKAESRTNLYSNKDKTLADNALFSITSNASAYNIGDTVLLTVGSSTATTVSLEVEKDNKTVSTYTIKLNNSKETIRIPVLENDLGGFVVHYSLSAFNHFKSGSKMIAVPYPKTDLKIETTTFRDKLQPGSDETWSFKIKGPKGEQVSAELLASMYDTSLDQFKTHNWLFNPMQQRGYYSNSSWNAYGSFGTKNFRVFNIGNAYYSYTHQDYDQINWFGLTFGNPQYLRRNYIRSIKAVASGSINANIAKGQIKGVVTDHDGLPLPGANVIIKGTSTGAQTDFDGQFELKANQGSTIVINYIGFKTLEIILDNANYYTIKLAPDSSTLDEVVVTGYVVEKPFISSVEDEESNDFNYFRGNVYKKGDFKDGDSPSRIVYDTLSNGKVIVKTVDKSPKKTNDILIRKNLQETAFFFPQLQTDSEGNVSFSFTTPEALTQWKLQLLAHTKTLESTTTTLETVTQKELMVIPNAPRFLRQGDKIVVSTKIANLTDKSLTGMARLELTDAITGEYISSIIQGETGRNYTIATELTDKNFSVDAKGNTQVSWSLTIPDTVNAIQYKILATTGDFSDGEQNVLPVLSNRMLVTETLPMWIKTNETKTFALDKLKTNTSTTLKHHKLSLEVTSNPAWYAVQALPYLIEYPYDCNEQTFSRYYANALASYIANSNPKIQAIFNQWASQDVLLSNLEKNEELKSLLIQETPWLRDAQSETEQKKRIALLFNLNKMNNELKHAMRKLKQNQMSNGAWPWFKGGYANRYITQHIITGFGHLNQLGVKQKGNEAMIKSAIAYLDSEFIKEYEDLKKYNDNIDLSKDHLSHTQLHYLYMRSFFPEVKKSSKVEEISNYYYSQIEAYWLSRSLYSKGLMTLISHRNNDAITASKILKSLKETSITSDELGMYWKANTASWYWHRAPIETQALLIEAFSEAGSTLQNNTDNLETIDNLKIWLLKNKQTNRWKTTKATTEAIYALLLQGSDWLSVTEMVEVVIGNTKVSPETLDNVAIEAGTGYFKTSWNATEIKPEMAEVTLTKKGNGIAWGSLYWQYFEDLDKIYAHEDGHLKQTPLSLNKKLFLKTNTDTGEQITEITKDTSLKVGDLVRVRIELRSDRDMEFLHMKDMRASGLEPINVLSQYKWQDGLGYYESTKDASTNFFFDYLPKGIYVFEYDLRVNNAGNMSNGITTIQSMYAPEFSSHSEGIRIEVSNE